MGDEVLGHAIGPQLPLDSGVFLRSSHRACARYLDVAARRHSRLHRVVLAAGSHKGRAIHPLRGVGRIRVATKWLDLGPELTVKVQLRERVEGGVAAGLGSKAYPPKDRGQSGLAGRKNP